MTQQHSGAPYDPDGAEAIDITPPPGGRGEPVDGWLWSREAEADMVDGVAAAPAGDDAAPASRGPSRTRLVVLGSLLAAGVAGAAVLGAASIRILQQKDATLDPPRSAAGLRLDDSSRAAETAEYLRTALAARMELDETTAAVYADPADDTRSVLFFGGTALIFTPGSDLDGAFELVSDRGGAAEVREVQAGDLGGVMKCGSVAVPEGTMSVCGWADHGSVALAMFQDRSPAEAEPLMRELREAIQSRS